MLSFIVGIGLLLSNSIALPLQQHQTNLDSNSINSNANLDNASNYQTSYDTSLFSSGTNAGWASSKPFSVMGGTNASYNFSYRENGFIMASGSNSNGNLGNGGSTAVGEAFALYKEGNAATPFYNAIDYNIDGYQSGIIDSTGKLYTAGYGANGNLGSGSTSMQRTFQQVLTAKDVSEESKANALPDDYKAVSIETDQISSGILLNDGTLYGAGRQNSIGLSTTSTAQSHFTRLDGRVTGLPEATSSNKIKDFSASWYSTWVLYENGELYMTSNSTGLSGKYTLVASDIKFFDLEQKIQTGSRVYAVNTSNQILSCAWNSTTLTTLVAEPNGTVTQVRASANGGWGYLNSDNELYLSTTAEGVVPGATNATSTGTTFYKMEDVAFFDLGGISSNMTYCIL